MNTTRTMADMDADLVELRSSVESLRRRVAHVETRADAINTTVAGILRKVDELRPVAEPSVDDAKTALEAHCQSAFSHLDNLRADIARIRHLRIPS